MAEGRSHVYGALVAEDTEAMARVLEGFGVGVVDANDPWAIDGLGRHLQAPTQSINVGESGLAARIAMVLATLADGGDTTIEGHGRLPQRPIRGLVDALVAQGVSITTDNGFLPVTVGGQSGLWGDAIEVDCSASSQFATAMLLGAPMSSRPANIKLSGLIGSSGYLDVTVEVMESFGAIVEPTITGFDVAANGYQATDYLVEPDASAAVYPMIAAAITRGRVELAGLRSTSKQPDVRIAKVLEQMGCQIHDSETGLVVDAHDTELQAIEVDLSSSPDGAVALAIACLFATGTSTLTGLFSLRHKESDRLEAVSTEIRRRGGQIEVIGDSLRISPSSLDGGTIEPYGDHRVAMSLALIGLVTPGISIAHPEVVNKTWPGFWQWLSELDSQQNS